MYYLNYFGVSEEDYTLGTITNNRICVLDNEDGYLVFDILNNQKKEEVFVNNFFDVVREIYKRTILTKLYQDKTLKLVI